MNKRLCVAAALLAVAAATPAQQLAYLGSGNNSTDWSSGILEAWGTGNAYATLDLRSSPAFAALFTRPAAVSQAALAGFASAQVSFGYDLAAPAISGSSNASGANSRYTAGPLGFTLQAAGGAVDVSSLGSVAYMGQSRTRTTFTLAPGNSTLDGPLNGSNHGYADSSPVSQALDLAAMLRDPGAYSTFDISGFSTLPVHVQGPTQYTTVGVSLWAVDINPHSAPYNTALPNPLRLQDYNEGVVATVSFDGIFTVTVRPEDFATQADYDLANAWVSSNLRQFNYEIGVSYQLDSLQVSAVPEPAPALLLAGGLAVLAWRRRASQRSAA